MPSSAAPARILYLDYTNEIGIGGGQRSLALLLHHLDRSHFQPLLVCPPAERILALIDRDIPVAPLPLPGHFRRLSRWQASWLTLPAALAGSWKAVAALHRVIEASQVRLIHANGLKMLWLARAAGRNIPIVWHVRDIFPKTKFHALLCRLGSLFASHVVTVSRAVAAQFHPGASLSVLYNAVELPDLPDAAGPGEEFRRRYSIPPANIVVGYAGRLDPGKGVLSLLQAFARANSKVASLTLMLVGEGPEQDKLRAEAARLDIAEKCVFVPFQKDMAPAWSAMDLCVLPSTQPDSFPRSVIEAMSYGKPVIASRTGGASEAIHDGVTGICYEAGNVEALGDHIRHLASHPGLARQMGASGRQRCEHLFTARTQAETLAALYHVLLDGQKQSGDKQ